MAFDHRRGFGVHAARFFLTAAGAFFTSAATGCAFWNFLNEGDSRATSQVLLEDYRVRRAKVSALEGTFTARYDDGVTSDEYQGRVRMDRPGDLAVEGWKPGGEWLFSCRVRAGRLAVLDPAGNERSRVVLRPGVPHLLEAGGGLDVEALARLSTAVADAGEGQDVIGDDVEGDPVVFHVFEHGLLVGERRLTRNEGDLVEESYLGSGRGGAQRVRYHGYAEVNGHRWPARAVATDPTGRSPKSLEIVWHRVRVNGGDPHVFDTAAPPAASSLAAPAPFGNGASPSAAPDPLGGQSRLAGLLEKKGVPFD